MNNFILLKNIVTNKDSQMFKVCISNIFSHLGESIGHTTPCVSHPAQGGGGININIHQGPMFRVGWA